MSAELAGPSHYHGVPRPQNHLGPASLVWKLVFLYFFNATIPSSHNYFFQFYIATIPLSGNYFSYIFQSYIATIPSSENYFFFSFILQQSPRLEMIFLVFFS